MGKFAAFKLPLKGMPDGTQEFEYELGSEFFRNMESSDVTKSDLKVTLVVKHANGNYDLNFIIKGIVYIPCDRCLDEMEHEVDTVYHLTVKYGETFSDEADDVLIIPESDNYLNVAYMIYDSVILTIPLKHVHPMGKCNKGMSLHLKKHAARNISDDDDADIDFELDDADDFESNDINNEDSKESDPRWDALKDLTDNN